MPPFYMATRSRARLLAADGTAGQEQHSSDNSKKVIIIVVCLVAFIIIKSGLAVWLYIRHRRRREERLRKLVSRKTGGSQKLDFENLRAVGVVLDKSEIRLLKDPNGQLCELGAGSFGKVVMGIAHGIQPVAIKLLQHRDRITAETAFQKEVEMLKFLSRNHHIVQFYGICSMVDGGLGIGLVTEFMEGGDLRRNLLRRDSAPLSWWNGGKQVALDMARGLAFLHSCKVIHRDLKPSNVLLTAEGVAKIADVGLAKLQNGEVQTSSAPVGTLAFMAPEMLLGERCSAKMDIYSFGVVLWEIASGRPAVRGHVNLPLDASEAPEDLCRIIEACMQRDPEQRPDVRDLYSCIVGKLDGMGCAARMLESCPDAYPPGRKVDSDTCSSSLFDSRLMTGSATGSATNSLQTICDTPESFDKSQGNSGLLTSGDSRVEVSTRPGNEV